MAVKGCNWSKKSQEDVDDLDLLDSCDECDKKFITGHDFEFHQRMFHAEDENSREYTLNQASALRITQLIGAQVQVGSRFVFGTKLESLWLWSYVLNRRVLSKFQDVRCISNMILYGAERETPINVNSMLMECLSKVILEAPIENEYEMRTENAMPTKVGKGLPNNSGRNIQIDARCNFTCSLLKRRTSRTCVASSTSSTAAQFA